MRAEIVAVGEELLLGKVLDENSRWLAEQLSELGFEVRRFTTVGDRLEEVVDAFAGALARGAEVVISTGGLGPTPDDLTVAAAAHLAGVPLRLDRAALDEMLARATRAVGTRAVARETAGGSEAAGGSARPELLPLFEKVASLPEGAQTLANPSGWAPGVHLRVGAGDLYLLPGPPREVRGIFDTDLRPRLERRSTRKRASLRAEVPMREAILSPLMQQVMASVPDVYVKAYVAQRGEDGWLPLDLVAFGPSEEAAAATLERARAELARLVAEAGYPFRIAG